MILVLRKQIFFIFRQSFIASLAILIITSLHFPVKAAEESKETFSTAQLEQLVAPIALYPDSLLTQILMASTYPLEVVQAARWVKDHKDVKGEALEDSMEKEPWDPSVKSLAAFPQVLDMMNEELSWTQQLGDAFLAQQKEVMDAVQQLRLKADNTGNLKSTKEQKVEKETVKAESGKQETVIIIEPADPEVIYVPSYNPTIVYGTWAYPAYPPYYWYPPGYVASRALWFGAGVAAGYALWGRADWRRGSVNINVNNFNRYNRTNITNKNWNHNPRHRGAVPYRGQKVASKYGRTGKNVRAREQFRGRADSGRRDLKRPDQRPKVGERPNKGKRPSTGKKPAKGKRPANTKKPNKVASRPSPKKAEPKQRPKSRNKPAAYRGVSNGKQVRKNSSRGKRSRQASRSSASSRHRGGGRGRRGGGGRRR
ncbi:MAG: DUF3300 domain-containing protein [Desulfobulbia bacterium]